MKEKNGKEMEEKARNKFFKLKTKNGTWKEGEARDGGTL